MWITLEFILKLLQSITGRNFSTIHIQFWNIYVQKKPSETKIWSLDWRSWNFIFNKNSIQYWKMNCQNICNIHVFYSFFNNRLLNPQTVWTSVSSTIDFSILKLSELVSWKRTEMHVFGVSPKQLSMTTYFYFSDLKFCKFHVIFCDESVFGMI